MVRWPPRQRGEIERVGERAFRVSGEIDRAEDRREHAMMVIQRGPIRSAASPQVLVDQIEQLVVHRVGLGSPCLIAAVAQCFR